MKLTVSSRRKLGRSPWLAVLWLSYGFLGHVGAVVGQQSIGDVETLLRTATSGYQQAMTLDDPIERKAAFQKVEMTLKSLLDSGESGAKPFTADLFVNWGNAAIQINDIGTAVLAYRKALLRDPFHPKALQNLNYVRAQLPNWARAKNDADEIWPMLFFWNRWLSPDQVQTVAAGFFAIACLLLGGLAYWKLSALRLTALLPFLVWCVLFFSTFSQAPQLGQDLVFVAEETPCHAADSENSPLSFEAMIPAGMEAAAIEKRPGWFKVELGINKSGWVAESSVRLID